MLFYNYLDIKLMGITGSVSKAKAVDTSLSHPEESQNSYMGSYHIWIEQAQFKRLFIQMIVVNSCVFNLPRRADTMIFSLPTSLDANCILWRGLILLGVIQQDKRTGIQFENLLQCVIWLS